ncbi:hypothetical protein BV898_18772 [Hypsibius exemplaris]|uniref:MRH domain-containing protein n=1 Tax=Hypsibius exemplaris TaxID=2072580 RepID=A0A9X6NKJ9_HYPEX|nr:hypothetical protein BV898_18772 [Hypsibius exemplaris]
MDSRMGSAWNAVIFLTLLLAIARDSLVRGDCSFTPEQGTRKEQKDLMSKLNALSADIRNQKFTTEDGKFKYEFQLCPTEGLANDFAGITQIQKSDGAKVAIVGRINETDMLVSARNDLFNLFYTKGDHYPNACAPVGAKGGGERHAIITIRCIPDQKEYFFDMLSESVADQEDLCIYAFEFLVPPGKWPGFFGNCSEAAAETSNPSARVGPAPAGTSSGSAVSPTDAARHGLGTGSIILIIIAVPLLAFFIIGSIYKRFVVGAQGWEQVPFIDFWRRCGSLQSDGWRYAFGRGRSAHGNVYDDYTAVNTDEERQPALDRTGNANDDHLLPM